MPVEKSAGAVIFRKDEGKIFYLLLHYEAGHWDFSKGHIEKGESLEDTALREVKEETGIEDAKFVEGFKERIKYFFKGDKGNIFKKVTFFLFETKQKEVKLSFEHIGYKWLSYKKVLSQLTFKNAKEILKKADIFLKRHSRILLG